MKYGITRRVLSCGQFLEISMKEFEDTVRVRNFFFRALGIEEKFDLVAENYSEFEHEIVQLTMRQMYFHDWDWSSMRRDIGTINRRFANVLSACRLYRDHVKHDISSIYGKRSEAYNRLCNTFSQEKAARLGYCILESLRDHIQHRGLPLYRLTYPGWRQVSGKKLGALKYGCVPCISLARLRADEAFSQDVLLRLPTDVDELDVMPLVRDYISGLGNVHKQLREWMTSDIEAWRHAIIEIKNRFTSDFGEEICGLAVVERNEDDEDVRFADIFDDFIEEYARLVRKNAYPEHYYQQFVSNEVSVER
jgi:hypothetical protein